MFYKGVKSGVIEIIDVAISLAPREIVSQNFFVRVKHDSSIKSCGIKKFLTREKIGPIKLVNGGEL